VLSKVRRGRKTPFESVFKLNIDRQATTETGEEKATVKSKEERPEWQPFDGRKRNFNPKNKLFSADTLATRFPE
jgi:hypothetical protein